MAKNNASNYAESSKYEWLIIVVAIFVLRITPWILAEYWYDEVLTLGDFALDAGERGLWRNIFRNYPVANNHILSSAVYWCWLRLINFNLVYEQFTRLPSIAFGIGLIALCVCHWRRWLGGRIANLGGLLLAVSPVFTAYAYQIRGYSMSMFLSGLAISGLLKFNAGEKKSGQLLMCLSCLLLPLTIPSNVLFAFMLAAVLFSSCVSRRKGLLAILPPLTSAFLGTSYYFTIWKQFVLASKEPSGWPSAWAVSGNLLLAFAIHGFVLLVALSLNMLFQKNNRMAEDSLEFQKTEPTPVPGMNKISPHIIAASSAIIICLTLLLSKHGQAPYPRVFLVFFPPLSFALLLSCSRRNVGFKAFPLLFVSILFFALVSERVSSDLTKMQLQIGISPNNLLQQYYRGNDDLRNAAQEIAKLPNAPKAIILVDEYDFPTMRMYAILSGLDGKQVATRNTVKQDFLLNMPHSQEYPLLIVAKNRCLADELLNFSGYSKQEKAILNSIKQLDIRSIFISLPPSPQEKN